MKLDSRLALLPRLSANRTLEGSSSNNMAITVRSSQTLIQKPTESATNFDQIVTTKVPSAASLTAVMHDNSLAIMKVLSKVL